MENEAIPIQVQFAISIPVQHDNKTTTKNKYCHIKA